MIGRFVTVLNWLFHHYNNKALLSEFVMVGCDNVGRHTFTFPIFSHYCNILRTRPMVVKTP